ncbi:hypothetical protein SDC9_161902 [bioreactor metagenome]|uniref:Uncharacterized protein n=1 Tax=bioreactor metagenome TaxID=1076179 RepID=A0A645FJJ8_9ZZZZ
MAEIYDEDFVAKRMEIGAVIAAAPKSNVIRAVPEKGDVVILVGGRTGRDGCGGRLVLRRSIPKSHFLAVEQKFKKEMPPLNVKFSVSSAIRKSAA